MSIALATFSVVSALAVGLHRGAQSLGILFPEDAVYLTVEAPRDDLEAKMLFAIHDDRSIAIRPYVWYLTWMTLPGPAVLDDFDRHPVRREEVAWIAAPEYVLVGRDENGNWRRRSFVAESNIRVVWNLTGTVATVSVPADAEENLMTPAEASDFGVPEWVFEMAAVRDRRAP